MKIFIHSLLLALLSVPSYKSMAVVYGYIPLRTLRPEDVTIVNLRSACDRRFERGISVNGTPSFTLASTMVNWLQNSDDPSYENFLVLHTSEEEAKLAATSEEPFTGYILRIGMDNTYVNFLASLTSLENHLPEGSDERQLVHNLIREPAFRGILQTAYIVGMGQRVRPDSIVLAQIYINGAPVETRINSHYIAPTEEPQSRGYYFSEPGEASSSNMTVYAPPSIPNAPPPYSRRDPLNYIPTIYCQRPPRYEANIRLNAFKDETYSCTHTKIITVKEYNRYLEKHFGKHWGGTATALSLLLS